MTHVVVLDYGMGNLHSVAKALEKVGAAHVEISNDPKRVQAADRVVLPGQGAMRDCMAEMRKHGVDQEVRDILHNKPLLGICVGMQALLADSEENGGCSGLNIYPGHVKFFSAQTAVQAEKLKVPHMGWNEVKQRRAHPLWQGIPDNSRFYFVHSYFCEPTDSALSVGETVYGLNFCCAIAHENVFAVQFHPEKSSDAGLQLLANFLQWRP